MEDILRSTLQGSLGGRIRDPNTVAEGDILHGQLEVVSLLGRGASAAVFKCRHLTLGNLLVAVKIFPEMESMSALEIKRLSREIISAHRIDHPNVTRFYDCIRDGNFVTIVSEYIEGGTLEDYKKANEIHVPSCVSILTQVASGLQSIHSAGIIHRDLKPQNILIGKDKIARITDFGIVSLRHRDPKNMYSSTNNGFSVNNEVDPLKTNLGRLVGTPFYLSPEYLDKNIVDEKLDIYAFGMVAYELMTREMPFVTDNLFDLIRAKLFTDPKPPREIVPHCPVELSDLIMRCLERDPGLRVQSARELLYQMQCLKGYVSQAHIVGQYTSDKEMAVANPPTDEAGEPGLLIGLLDTLFSPIGFVLSVITAISTIILLGLITEDTFFSKFVDALRRLFL